MCVGFPRDFVRESRLGTEIQIISFLQNKAKTDHDNSSCDPGVCHTMFENFALCNMRRTTQSCSVHLFGIVFEICFYSTLKVKKRVQTQQIGSRAWVVYNRDS